MDSSDGFPYRTDIRKPCIIYDFNIKKSKHEGGGRWRVHVGLWLLLADTRWEQKNVCDDLLLQVMSQSILFY